MNVCNSVAQLPTDGNYRLFGDDAEHLLLRRFIEKFRPGLCFGGFVGADDMETESYILVSSPSWQAPIAELAGRGVAEQRIVLFLMPLGDYCGWVDFFEPVLDSIRPKGDGFTVPWTSVHDRMRSLRCAAIGKLGTMLLEPDRYFSHHVPTDEDRARIEVVASAMSVGQAEKYRGILATPPMPWIETYVGKVFDCVQYFEHAPLSPGDVIINCGVADGWELPYYLSVIGESGRIHCIDPTGTTYLSPFARACFEANRDRVELIETAVMDFEGKGAARIKGNMAFVRPATGPLAADEAELPCTTLDTLVRQRNIDRIDLIKIDIEGCEMPALRGMLETIRRFRPSLALSVYHRPTDLWEIPHLILQTVADYTVMVESYCYNRSETIAYLIPRERLGKASPWGIAGVKPRPIDVSITDRLTGQIGSTLRWLMAGGKAA
jgi:FkbM family methyltransferase